MKTFIAAIVIFSILVCFITANCIYISKFSKKLNEFADSFPENSLDGAEEIYTKLEGYWRENEFYVMLSNDHTRIHEIYRSILTMKAALIAEDFSLYCEARLALKKSAEMIGEYDSFSLIGVL